MIVSTTQELKAALASATGGETILLAPGTYDEIRLVGGAGNFAEDVTIASADPLDKAVVLDIAINGAKNIIFEGLIFDYLAEGGGAKRDRPFNISESEALTFRGNIFDGAIAHGVADVDNGKPTGIGLNIRDSSDISVTDNYFTTFHRGAVFDHVDDLVITSNEITDMRSDGLNFVGVRNVLIEDNYIHDFLEAPGSTDHRDFIQFWTNGADRPSSDVTIRGNVLDSNEGSWAQSIFIRNEEVDRGRAGLEFYYQNILIEENVIRNAHHHGISVGETDGLIIRNNTIVQNAATWDEGAVSVPKISVNESALNVTVTGNVLPLMNIPEDVARANGWIVDNNVEIQRDRVDAPNYQGTLFVNGLSDGGGDVLADLAILPDSDLVALKLGASMLYLDGKPEFLIGTLDVDVGTGLRMMDIQVDIGTLIGPNGLVDPASVTDVIWDFGDGTTAMGTDVLHSYTEAGNYEITAEITLDDGQTLTAVKTIFVDDPVALVATFDDGVADISDVANKVVAGSDTALVSNAGGFASDLAGGLVSFDADQGFITNDSYTLLIDFNTNGGGEGRLVTYIYSFTVDVARDGLSISLTTDDGTERLRIDDLGLSKNDWHRLALTFDGEEGVARVYLDGAEVGQIVGLDGSVQVGHSSQNLHLGDPHGKGFDGLVDNFTFLRGALSAEEITGRGGLDTSPSAPEFFEFEAEVALSFDDDGQTKGRVTTKQQAVLADDGTLVLDGMDSYAEIGRLSELADAEAITLALTFNAHTMSEDDPATLIRNHGQFGLDLVGNKLVARVIHEDTLMTSITTGPLAIEPGAWHDAAVVMDTSKDIVQIYLDGELVHEESNLGMASFSEPGWDASVGGTPWGRVLDGQIDNLIIASEAFDSTKIKDIASGAAVAVPVDPFAALERQLDKMAVTQIDFSGSNVKFRDDASLVTSGDRQSVKLDGQGDYVDLGKMTDLGATDKLGFGMDVRFDDVADVGGVRLLWNHLRYGVEFKDDTLHLRVFEADGTQYSFSAEADLDNGAWHEISIAMDASLGLVSASVNGERVIEAGGLDLALDAANGWNVMAGGTAWGRSLDGEVSDLWFAV